MSSRCRVESHSASHCGYVRAHNEDAILDFPAVGLWAVADGMGGHDAGALASRTLIASLYALGSRGGGRRLVANLDDTLQVVNGALVDEARRRSPDCVIGSTVAVLVLEEDCYHCFWAGDSRIYLWRAGSLRRLTGDHVATGETGEVLTRAVGASPRLALEHIRGHSYEGDLFLLCSDGLTRMVGDPVVAQLLLRTEIDLACDALVGAALSAGGRDNISCVTVSLTPMHGAAAI